MRWSQIFVPTLRDDPADAEAHSHRLMLRAGMIRQLGAGLYSKLPLGWRVQRRVEAIVREEMEDRRAGVPSPRAASGRSLAPERPLGCDRDEMFRLRDRKNVEPLRVDACGPADHRGIALERRLSNAVRPLRTRRRAEIATRKFGQHRSVARSKPPLPSQMPREI